MSRPQGFTPATRKVIANRAMDFADYQPTCEIMAVCQGVEGTAIHHRRARGSGSTKRPETNQPANGLVTCDACHWWAESERDKARTYGWLLRQYDVPSDVPVLRRGVWVLLDNDGGYTRCPAPVAIPGQAS